MSKDQSKIILESTEYGRKVRKYYCKNWTTSAFYFSDRSVLDKSDKFELLEINKHSIYFLIGEQDNKFRIYVGRASEDEEGMSAIRRIKQHCKSTKDWYKDLWDEVIVFKFNDISFDEMRWLEDYFFNNIKSDILLNKSNPDHSNYTKEEISDQIRYIKEYTNKILGANIFKADKEIDRIIRIENNLEMNFSDTEKKLGGTRVESIEAEEITEMRTPSTIVEAML